MSENKNLVIAEREDLVAIADATRNATGTTEQMSLYGIANAINEINGGINMEIVQQTGTSTTAVMSQAAVTNELNGLSEEIANLTLGVHTDGLIYLYVNGQPVGNGIPQGVNGDVVGMVNPDNSIVITGTLPDGTYTLKYEMEDGTLIDIGDLALGSEPTSGIVDITWSAETKLDKTTGASASGTGYGASQSIEIVDGRKYTAKATKNSNGSINTGLTICYYDANGAYLGYEELWSGDTSEHSEVLTPLPNAKSFKLRAYYGSAGSTMLNCFSLSWVKLAYTNLADPTSAEWLNDTRLKSGGTTTGNAGSCVTNYVPCVLNNTVYIQGLKMGSALPTSGTSTQIEEYDASGTRLGYYFVSQTLADGTASNFTYDSENDILTYTVKYSGTASIRACGTTPSNLEDVIITVNEEIV